MIKEHFIQAIRFKAFGDPSVLEPAKVVAPNVRKTTALVRVMAASINPSDVKNLAGAMKQRHCHVSRAAISPARSRRDRPTGLEARSGAPAAVPASLATVTHAEMLVVPVASLRRKPEILSFSQAASVG
jgi:NADPH:quinone reductase